MEISVCVARNSETIGTTDLISGIYCSGCELVHLGIFIHPVLTLTELWALICENMEISVSVARNSETIGTTDLELQGYIFMPPPLKRGVHIDLPVSVRPSLKSLCESGTWSICVLWTHFCPLCIVKCLFCKTVVWDGGICFCDRKLASSSL